MIFLVRDILPVIATHANKAGVSLCTTQGTDAALTLYNRINEVLMNRHDWPGADAHIQLPIFGSTFALPPRFESIKALRIDNQAAPILGCGFQYLPSGPGTLTPCSGHHALQHLGNHYPTARDLPHPYPLFAVTDAEEETTITIQGTSYDGRFLRQTLPVVTAYPDRSPIHTTHFFATITAVTKPRTQGHVTLCAWDDATGNPLWLSTLEPTDTTPSYTRYLCPLSAHQPSTINHQPAAPTTLTAHVSLAYRELWDLDDVSLIQHREAYRLMAQSLAFFDAQETAKGSEYQARAIKLLKERAAKLATGQAQALPFQPSRQLNTRPYSIRGY